MGVPEHPEVVVDLVGQAAKPIACVAVVRRELRKAGFREAAKRFTDEAFGGAAEEIIPTARRYVTVVD